MATVKSWSFMCSFYYLHLPLAKIFNISQDISIPFKNLSTLGIFMYTKMLQD